eukprot:7369325-Pyramimonas_sp.AAC.1
MTLPQQESWTKRRGQPSQRAATRGTTDEAQAPSFPPAGKPEHGGPEDVAWLLSFPPAGKPKHGGPNEGAA